MIQLSEAVNYLCESSLKFRREHSNEVNFLPNITLVGYENTSILHAAVFVQYSAVVKKLLDDGADPKLSSGRGTPLAISQQSLSWFVDFSAKNLALNIYNLLKASAREVKSL